MVDKDNNVVKPVLMPPVIYDVELKVKVLAKNKRDILNNILPIFETDNVHIDNVNISHNTEIDSQKGVVLLISNLNDKDKNNGNVLKELVGYNDR